MGVLTVAHPLTMNTTHHLSLLLFTVCTLASAALVPKALWQFGGMIQCAQPGINPLKYNDYGCWCGFGGKGVPLDEVDACCKIHDNCYYEARRAPGCTALADNPYTIDYDYTCSNQQVTCTGTNDQCQAAVCECDRVSAHCFGQNTYNPEHKNVDQSLHCVV